MGQSAIPPHGEQITAVGGNFGGDSQQVGEVEAVVNGGAGGEVMVISLSAAARGCKFG